MKKIKQFLKKLKYWQKGGLISFFIGLLLILLMYIAGYVHSYTIIDFLILLMYIPTRIYVKFFPCTFEGGDCLFYGIEEVIFYSPLYLAILGILIGLIIGIIKKK